MSRPLDQASPFERAELEAVGGLMLQVGIPVSGRLGATLIAGGRSNITARLHDEAGSSWVLRMPPRTGRTPSAHDVAREFRVVAALAGTDVPVPEALLLHEDEAVLGGPFTVTEYVDGRTIQLRSDLEAQGPEVVDALVTRLVEALVCLHRVDPAAVGLEGFGRPAGYAARQLSRWSRQWSVVGDPALAPLADSVVSRLEQAVAPQERTSVVHGDFRIDNTLVRVPPAGSPEVLAVIDWELSTLGDPVADVAMMCAYRHKAFDAIVGAPSAWGSDLLPSADQLAERYQREDGASLEHWEFHLGLAYYKVAVIAAGIDHRRLHGSGEGQGFATACEAVPAYLEAARDSLGVS